jgi:hypothetical protein
MKVLQQPFFAHFCGFYEGSLDVYSKIGKDSSRFRHSKADREGSHGLTVENLLSFICYAAFFSE